MNKSKRYKTLQIEHEAGSETAVVPFFRKIDWSAFWTACVVSFVVYFYTLAPTVTLEDSGELAVAADYLGVPHPPGYPIWTMLSWLISRIFRFVHYLGQPNPAWSVGLLSAIFGALAAGITAMLICRSGSDMIRRYWKVSHEAGDTTGNYVCWTGGVVSSLLFAFSPVMWSQTVIVEVYALNAFFLVLIFLLAYMWIRKPSDKLLYFIAFTFGLGLTNYQVLFLAALVLAIVIMLEDLELFRDFCIVGVPYVVFIFMKGGIGGFLESMNDPLGNLSVKTSAIYLFANFGILALAYFLLPRGKAVALTILFVQIGISFYLYMPIVSDLRNPPMNWGYPRTWQGFKHAVTRGQYEKINPTDVFSLTFINQIGSYLTDLTKQFYLPIALIGFLPFTTWRIKIKKITVNGLLISIGCALIAILLGVAEPAGARWDKLPVIGIFIAMGLGGTAILVNITMDFWNNIFKPRDATWSRQILSALILIGGVLIVLFIDWQLLKKIHVITEPLRGTNVNMQGSDVTTMFWQCIGILVLVIVPPTMFAAGAWLQRTRFKTRMSIGLLSQKWIIATLSGFLVMSCILIALCSPKGDIQDNFIQKVKFISSHALYAFWIGYGLIFAMTVLDPFLRRNKLLRSTFFALLLMLPLAPIYKNYYNPVIIKEYGGAEQNGHDFGWQFGNYQLRGADAITEELDAEEEPLPNPEFPEEMTPDAVFFGGTDPGRFVPTYMIYSAQVRPDVYLITQNALADNTYLNVMRDLYGDKIWMPSQTDSAESFRIYIEEVRAGKRPKNADLKIDKGRVQVSGALGVMEINGIICKMIFDNNNYKHDFYVEESYVIQWMFPYISPHGLIMKINKNPVGLDQPTINNDLDFWDWYTRRLTSSIRFMRDITARKSFSKLRSAIAGAYASRNMLNEAERAFQEARLLYPLSPEANFRLAQEVLWRQARFEECAEMIRYLGDEDPENTKVPEFLGQINNLTTMRNRITELEKQMPKLDINNAFELAGLYQRAGQLPKLRGLIGSIVANTNMPIEYTLRAASILHDAKQFADMATVLDNTLARMPDNSNPEMFLHIARLYAPINQPNKMAAALGKYLNQKTDDWRGWLDMAAIELMRQNNDAASKALDNAVRYGGNNALQIINGDQRFAALRSQSKTRLPQNFLGLPQPGPGKSPLRLR